MFCVLIINYEKNMSTRFAELVKTVIYICIIIATELLLITSDNRCTNFNSNDQKRIKRLTQYIK